MKVPHRDEASDSMKRVGYVYEQMSDWVTIVEAEAISTKRKGRNRGVIRHQAMRWKNLVEIQESIISILVIMSMNSV